MSRIFPFIIIILVCTISCKSGTNKQAEKAIVEDTTNYFPVNFYIGEDIRSVVQSKAKIYKAVFMDKSRIDSVPIDSTEFNALAKKFLEKDITSLSIKRFYKESIFRSLATNSVTFNYASINPSLDIKSVDANMDEEGKKLNRVDIRVISSKNDSSFTENYCWLPGQKFYITKYAEGKDAKGVLTTTTVTWHK